MQLRLTDTVEVIQLSANKKPSSVAARVLLERLQMIGKGLEILPYEERDTILRNETFRETTAAPTWRVAFQQQKQRSDLEVDGQQQRQQQQPVEDAHDLPGRIPTLEELNLVMLLAEDCCERDHEEAAWNAEVHMRLLEFVFRKPYSMQPVTDSVDVTYWLVLRDLLSILCRLLTDLFSSTTARPDTRWLPYGGNVKMVDFVLYAPTTTSEARNAARNLCFALSMLTVNHITFEPLQFDPILVSIETKKPDVEARKAQLQMAVWHSAQRAFLKEAVRAASLARRRSRNREEGYERESDEETDAETEQEVANALAELPFLPGILVTGHRWAFAMSTCEQDMGGISGRNLIKFWRGPQFGSSEGLLDLFQVVAGLREIAGWAVNIYLPWLRRHTLCITGS